MNIYLRLGAALMAVSALSACATITRGTKEKFYVNSDPDGADVEMSNGLRCHTPCKLKVDRKSDMTVRVMKAGFQPAEVHVQGKVKAGGVAGGVVGNALLGGLIGLGVDSSTGAMLDLKPNPVSVKLVPLAEAVPVADSAVPATAATAPAEASQPAVTPAAATEVAAPAAATPSK